MRNLNITQLIEMWIHVSPDRIIERPLDSDGSATARANFIGINTADPDSKGESIYSEKQNLPNAIASILNHSQNKANFHPATQSPDDLVKFFEAYINHIDATPFFTLLDNERSKESFESKDYNALIDQVVNLYDSVSTNDKNAIRDSIADMAKSVFGQSKAEEYKNLFSQSTLNLDDPDNPVIIIYYTTLHMQHEKNGKSEVNLQEYTVNKTMYGVLPDLIRTHAKQLTALESKSVDDWVDDSISPEDPDVKLCF